MYIFIYLFIYLFIFPSVLPPLQAPSSATGLPEEPKMCTFELHDCNSGLGQSSQNLKMHRLMVTAAKLFFIQTIFKSFSLFVRKTSSRQSTYSLHQQSAFINIVFL